MSKKAVLIASQTFGLEGCRHDLVLMERCLAERGFDVAAYQGKAATRAGILTLLNALIEETGPNDAIVIFYSGHGGLAANPVWRPNNALDPDTPRFFQFIVPTDMAEGGESDFRGVLNLELARLLAKLTRKTRDVTVILDCCHSASMFRDMRSRALDEPWSIGIAQHLARLRVARSEDWRSVTGNRHAVRLAAAGLRQSAFEYSGREQRPVGVFTETLVAALCETKGLSVSWSTLLKGVRERVLAIQPWQRPEVEGPCHRLLFDMKEAHHTGVLTFFNGGGPFSPRPSLRGGRLMGVEVGNVYALTPRNAMGLDPAKKVGTATVTDVFGGVSRVAIEPAHLPAGLLAIPVEEAFPTCPVTVRGEWPLGLREAVAASKYLRAAERGEAPIATVHVSRGVMKAFDRHGLALAPPTYDVDALVQNLVALARARSLRELASGEGDHDLSGSLEVSWGRVERGRPIPLDEAEPVFFSGDRIYANLENRTGKTLYVNLIDIGVSHRIFVLNRSQLSGIEVLADAKERLGFRPFDGLVGLKLSWPRTVPADGPRMGTWLTIVSDRPQDLTMLESGGVVGGDRASASALQRRLEQIQTASNRKLVRGDGAEEMRYAVLRTDFLLDPRQRPGARES